MIDEITKLQGVGMLHGSIPDGGLALSKAVAIYAENGRGKSTLVHLLRSLSNNDCTAVLARQALRQEGEPYAELRIDGVDHTLSQGSWDKTWSGLYLFDDRFVAENTGAGDVLEARQLERLLASALDVEGTPTPEDVEAALDDCLDGINSRLRGFIAEFELATLEWHHDGAAPHADFTLRLMGAEVPRVATGGGTSPDFSTLSPAARRLFALALLFRELDDDPEVFKKTVVLDDPTLGLDRRRKTAVAEAIAGFAGRAQVIVLSHDAELIRMLRERGFDQVLQFRRSGVYCVVEECDIDAVLAEDHTDRPPTPGESMALL